MPRRTKRPSVAMHVEEVPCPRSRRTRRYRAMASSMNFNTVWSAISSPCRRSRSSPLRQGARPVGQAPRPAVPRRRLRRLRRRPAPGSAVSKWKPGDRVVVHPNDVALEDPQGHDDAISAPTSACGASSRTTAGWARSPGEGRPADAEAGAPDLGGGRRRCRSCNSHRLPDAGRAERRAMQQGDVGADLGRDRRAGRLRGAVRAERRRNPGLRRVVAGEGRSARGGPEAVIDRARARLPVLADEDTQD